MLSRLLSVPLEALKDAGQVCIGVLVGEVDFQTLNSLELETLRDLTERLMHMICRAELGT